MCPIRRALYDLRTHHGRGNQRRRRRRTNLNGSSGGGPGANVTVRVICSGWCSDAFAYIRFTAPLLDLRHRLRRRSPLLSDFYSCINVTSCPAITKLSRVVTIYLTVAEKPSSSFGKLLHTECRLRACLGHKSRAWLALSSAGRVDEYCYSYIMPLGLWAYRRYIGG